MIEIWKDIEGYEGLYQISNFSNVKSLNRYVKHPSGKERFIEGKIMKKQLYTKGYYRISLCKESNKETCKIHQLVAIAFMNHKKCGYDKVIDHIDSDTTNNRVDNLRIVSNRFNCSRRKNVTSKYPGVHFNKSKNKWRAYIQIKGKNVYLGYFKDEYKAHLAYEEKLKEI